MIITIDGSAGSGKSTVASKLAIKLGFIHLNSGALFRVVGLRAAARNVSLDDDSAVQAVARALKLDFERRPDGTTALLVDGAECGAEIQTEEAGALASRVALLRSVRQSLLEVQREVGVRESLVVEGRDAGSVVFPDADAKFYLDASPRVRAERRLASECGSLPPTKDGEQAVEEMLSRIEERDRRDRTRPLAPQVQPEGATLIDTSDLTPDEVVEKIAASLGL